MSTQPAAQPRQILLIEDEEEHAAIIERAFQRAGTAHLTVASTLAEAAAAINASAFVLVISDWHLPDGDALDLFNDNRPIPVLIMTSRGNERIAVKAMRAGALDYVVKSESSLHDMPELAESAIQLWDSARARELTRENEAQAREIEEQKRFESMLQEKNVALEKASAAKDRFLSNMSHELRTPLNAILGFTGTLLMKLAGPLTPDQEKFLHTVQTSGRHLLSLITDLLDLAKIESGKVELTIVEVRCGDVGEQVVNELRQQAEGKGLTLTMTKPARDLTVNADSRALYQILLNLITNAIKFTERGSVMLEIRLCGGAEKGMVEFLVADSGCGISAEDRKLLFQEFQQFGESARRQGGTGLGLHISQKLAELLAGKITVESEPGKGSTFRLLLPAAALSSSAKNSD